VRWFALRFRALGIWTYPISLLCLTGIIVAINWRLVENSAGCVTWSNYLLPCSSEQYAAWLPLYATWLPLPGLGGPTALPFTNIIGDLTSFYPYAALSQIIGPAHAAAAYAVLASLFFAGSFILFAGSIIKDFWARIVATIALVAGPFQFQLYVNGDYVLFTAEAFVFLAIYFLWRSIRQPDHRWVYYPSSLGCLLLSLGVIQTFELGFVLYAIFLALIILLEMGSSVRQKLGRLGKLALRFLLVPLLLLPLILPAVESPPFSLNPTSSFSNPVTIFSNYSANPGAVFLGLGYVSSPGSGFVNNVGFAMIAATTSTSLAAVWLALTITLVLLVWTGVILLRDRRGIYLLGLSIGASLLGSGSQGPLGGFNTYLYLHLTGYQAVNGSYYWDFAFVVPFFALGLGVLLERVGQARAESGRATRSGETNEPEVGPPRLGRLPWWPSKLGRASRPIGIAVATLLVLVIVIPYSVGAQNGPNDGQTLGIQIAHYPSDYSEIPGDLSSLVGPSYAGVAVFNPSPQWNLTGAATVQSNYFLVWPTERVPDVPSYNYFPFSSALYTYWVYDQLYSNQTRYAGEFLALMGVGFLLVFYNTQPYPGYLAPWSEGVNVSQRLIYQTGIIPVVTSRSFAIYQDLYFSGSAESLDSLSLIAGGYSELNNIAYAGVNVVNQATLFASDLPPNQCANYLSRTSEVFAESANALEGLGLNCMANYSLSAGAWASGSDLTTQGWTSSYSYTAGAIGTSVVESWPTPLAVTDGGPHAANLPIDAGNCPACQIWALVRIKGDGGSLSFSWRDQSWILQTDRAWDGINNSMEWVQLPFQQVSGSGTLRITSLSGVNAIGNVYVASPAGLASWLTNLSATKSVMVTLSGGEMAPPILTNSGQAWNYCGLQSLDSIDRTSLCLQSLSGPPISVSLSLPGDTPGELSLLVRSTSFADLEVGSSASRTFGFDTTDSNLSTFRMGWLRVPVSSSDFGPNETLSLTLERGVVFLSEIVYAPLTTYGQFQSLENPPVLSGGVATRTPTVTQFNVSASGPTAGYQTIAGDIQFTSPGANQYLASVTLNRSRPIVADVGLEYTVSPGLILNFDGIRLAGSGDVGFSQYSSSLLSVGARANPGSSNLTFYSSLSNTSTEVNASFSIQFAYGTMLLNSSLSNVESGTNWTVTSTTDGYQLAGGPASLVLVRVPFYPTLAVSPSSFALEAAFGSVDSIIVGSVNSTHFTVTTKAAAALTLGLEIMGGTFAAWVAAEFLWVRRTRSRSRRFTENAELGKGPAQSTPGPSPTDSAGPERESRGPGSISRGTGAPTGIDGRG
jgi:hypothetical protein